MSIYSLFNQCEHYIKNHIKLQFLNNLDFFFFKYYNRFKYLKQTERKKLCDLEKNEMGCSR